MPALSTLYGLEKVMGQQIEYTVYPEASGTTPPPKCRNASLTSLPSPDCTKEGYHGFFTF